MQFGQGSYFKVIYTHRKVTDFVQHFINQDTGTTDVVLDGVDFGTFSNRLWANTNDGERKYDGVQFQAAYRATSRWNVSGNYTLQINNDGNQEGEGTNQPGAPSFFPGYYPEIFNEARTYPIGRLSGFQKHAVRAWTTYDLGLGRVGDLNPGLLYRFDSGRAYSIRSTGRALTPVQRTIGGALYPDLPTSQTIFYSLGRGTENYENAHLFDLAVTYSLPFYKSAQHLGQGRDAEHVQLHAPHRLQHHGHSGRQQPAGRARHPDRLHQGRLLRQGDRDRALSLPARVLRDARRAVLVSQQRSTGRGGSGRPAPVQSRLEQALAALEGGPAALAFASGMAAGSAYLQSLPDKSHILFHHDVYYAFRIISAEILERWGCEAEFVDMCDVGALRNAIRPNTRLVWMETPSNPLMNVVDIAAVAEIAHGAGAKLVVDGTFGTPILQSGCPSDSSIPTT